MKLATNPNRNIRRKACLAYDALCNKEKYIQKGNLFKVKVKDCFYYTVIGDLSSLKNAIENQKSLLNLKDGLGRSLLYLAARNGYFDLTDYLIKKGININEAQNGGSTALHGAAYYGQEIIVQLLIESGINTKIKNKFNSTAADEAKTPIIREIILKSEEDKIMNLFHDLYSKGLVSNIITIKKKEKL
jgi:ankyrin repeat protein